MRTQMHQNSAETSISAKGLESSSGTAATSGISLGMLWGEAFQHACFADNPALVEALGSHFDPDSARQAP
jgi:hypothetical protein